MCSSLPAIDPRCTAQLGKVTIESVRRRRIGGTMGNHLLQNEEGCERRTPAIFNQSCNPTTRLRTATLPTSTTTHAHLRRGTPQPAAGHAYILCGRTATHRQQDTRSPPLSHTEAWYGRARKRTSHHQIVPQGRPRPTHLPPLPSPASSPLARSGADG
jgi:hypothetical protein